MPLAPCCSSSCVGRRKGNRMMQASGPEELKAARSGAAHPNPATRLREKIRRPQPPRAHAFPLFFSASIGIRMGNCRAPGPELGGGRGPNPTWAQHTAAASWVGWPVWGPPAATATQHARMTRYFSRSRATQRATRAPGARAWPPHETGAQRLASDWVDHAVEVAEPGAWPLIGRARSRAHGGPTAARTQGALPLHHHGLRPLIPPHRLEKENSRRSTHPHPHRWLNSARKDEVESVGRDGGHAGRQRLGLHATR